jgi:hypothetical protein
LPGKIWQYSSDIFSYPHALRNNKENLNNSSYRGFNLGKLNNKKKKD